MKNYIKYTFLLLMGWLTFSSVSAADNYDITVLCYNHGDSVSLRWVPASEKLFQRSVTSGYLVQRRTVGESKWTTLSTVLRPMSREKFDLLEIVNPDAAVVGEILYPSNNRNEQAEESTDPYAPKIESVPGQPSFEEQMLYVMAVVSCDISIDVAKAAALHYVDKTVDKSATYEYRVIFSDDVKKSKTNVSVAKVDMTKKTILPASTDFEGNFDETYVHFQWSVANHTGYYSAYNIERSLDGVHFTPLRNRPFFQSYNNEELADLMVFRDSFPVSEGTFYYRLKGYSPFGFYGPTSNVVKGEPKFVFEKINVAIDTIIVGKKNEEIKWTMDKKFESKIKGFKISRTPDYKKFFYENDGLIDPSQRSFKTNTKYEKTQYYAVIAVGKNDTPTKRQEKQSSYALSFRSDTIPPAVPTGLKALVDSTGLVSLSWTKNEEPDIRGYQLFVSNSGKEDDYYTLIDTIYPLTTFSYTIPLNTLTNHVYYRVNAIDRSFNRSQWSKAIKLIKPDTIAPAPVVFRLLQQPNQQIVVQWENSPSEDLASMDLYRQIDDTGKVVLIKHYDLEKKKAPTKFEDPYSFNGEQVRYFMKLYDEAGNMSQSRSSRLKAKGDRPGCISNLQLQVTNLEDKKEVKLVWTVTTNAPILRYVIYKKKDDGPMLDIASVPANQSYYSDTRLTVGSSYKYIVRPISTEQVCPAVYSEEVPFTGTLK